MVIQEESKLYFFKEQLNKLPLTKTIYILQKLFAISFIMILILFIYSLFKSSFNVWILFLVLFDLIIYLVFINSFDSAKNYKFIFYDNKVEYKFELIKFSKEENLVNSIIVISDINNIRVFKNKKYCYIYGNIEIKFIANNDKAKPFVTEDIIKMKKIKIPLNFKDGYKILENLEELKSKVS